MSQPKPAQRRFKHSLISSAFNNANDEEGVEQQEGQSSPQQIAWGQAEDLPQLAEVHQPNELQRRNTLTPLPAQRRTPNETRTTPTKHRSNQLTPSRQSHYSSSESNVPSPIKELHTSDVRRLSVDDSSIEGSRSQTPQSRTYRDKLRDRIESVREKAGSSVAQSRPRPHLSSIVRQSSSRFDEILQEEETSVAAALERHEEARSQWQAAAASSHVVASADAAYDFFTQVWDDDEPPDVDEPAATSPRAEEITEDDENVKLTTADYLGLKDEWDIVQHVPATPPSHVEAAREKELYFYPSSSAVAMEKKLPQDRQPRYLEGEGLYVGSKPYASRGNVNRLEWRLLTSGDHGWFGEDGEVETLPDPLRPVACKPAMTSDAPGPEQLIVYKPAEVCADSRQAPLPGRHLLRLHLSSLGFTHHALFSREHVMARRVADLYADYARGLASREVERLGGRLEAMRRARDSVREGEHGEERARRYVQEIASVRRQHRAASLAARQLLAQLIARWHDLAALRETQGYACTAVTLDLVTPDTGVGDGEEAWAKYREELEREVREVGEERQEEYNQEVEEYRRRMSEWNKQRKAARKAAKSRGADTIEPDTAAVIPEPEPTPPPQPDLKAIRGEVTAAYHAAFRPPSEPDVRPELHDGRQIDARVENNKEQQRRAAVAQTSVSVRVVFNEREVCRSRSYTLGQRFLVEMGLDLQIQIQQWPESLKIQVYESSGLSNHLISEVFVPLPDRTTTLPTAHSERLCFSSARVSAPSHSGVGSGVAFTETMAGVHATNCLYTTGVITCRTGWAQDAAGNTLAPPEKYLKYAQRNTPDWDANITPDMLTSWAHKAQLDPNDPRNASFFRLMEAVSRRGSHLVDHFRLDPLEPQFCTDDEIDSNPRLRLLWLRDRGEPEFRALKLVPIREKEIDTEIFKMYRESHTTPEARDLDVASPLDAHRARGRRWLMEVRQRALQQCRLAQQHRSLQDVVVEDQVLAISTLGLTFLKWLQPKRPLRPTRRERKKVAVGNLGGQEVRLVVNVVRAFEVPVRKDAGAANANGAFPSVVPVRPFVEATFQGRVARTTAADGANPTWNQDLHLPLRPPRGDYMIADCLHLHLFDETVVDLLEDDRFRDTNIHQRLERNWLASLRIPFTTLYHNSRIEGTFKLYSPPVLLGYEREPQQRRHANADAVNNDVPMQRDATFLTLFVTVQPALNPPEPFKEDLESGEMDFVSRHLHKWRGEMAAMFPHRHVKTLVLDASGKALCITRFFRPLQPPVLDETVETTEEMAARFVSMIPVVAGSVLFPGLFDIWLTSQQVLSQLCGDSEDLAVLLCCMLRHMQVRAWVLLGAGVPHGASAYVLTRAGAHRAEYEYSVWDPATGHKYSVRDSFCPLQRVYCIVDEDNIWANVQREEAPQRTRYDLTSRADWCPAFGRAVSTPTGSAQPAALEYRATSSAEVQRLQDKVEKRLRECIACWRRSSRTLWNRYCVALLRKMLPALERAAWGVGDASVDHLQELQHILGSHKMCGFPINLPYTDMDAITEAVRATGVHFNENPDVEFALAVHIHAFPSDVLSVWVYVASLTRRR